LANGAVVSTDTVDGGYGSATELKITVPSVVPAHSVGVPAFSRYIFSTVIEGVVAPAGTVTNVNSN
jgi:hypothetical protein